MRRFFSFCFALTFIFIFFVSTSQPAQAGWTWQYVASNPRSATTLSQNEAANWFVSAKGQNDLTRQGLSAQQCEEVEVYVSQNGVEPILIRKDGYVSWDNGSTWAPGQFRNLTFGDVGTVVAGDITIAWKNREQATGYYPAYMYGWVSVLVDACGNMIQVWRPEQPVYTPPPTVDYPPPTVPPAGPPVTIINNMSPTLPIPTCGMAVGGGQTGFIYPGGVSASFVPNNPVNVNQTQVGGGANVGPITNVNVNTNNNVNQNINQNPISIGIGVGN